MAGTEPAPLTPEAIAAIRERAERYKAPNPLVAVPPAVRDIEALLAALDDARAALARAERERDQVAERVAPMADYIVNTARHRRGCQRARCARPFCDACVCSCGLDAAMRAALAGRAEEAT